MMPMIRDPRIVVVSIVLQVVVILECPFVSKIQVAKMFFVPSHKYMWNICALVLDIIL